MTKSPHAIKARDVHMGINKNKILFILHSSKTHGVGNKPQLVKISQRQIKTEKDRKVGGCTLSSLYESYSHNPFHILHEYIANRPAMKTDNEQFFVFSDGSPVRPDHMRNILRLLLNNIQLQAELYSVHSMHVGCASDLLEYGISVETIKKLGHWKSNAVFTYLRH